MSLNRSNSALVVGVLVLLLGGPVLAQDLEEMKLFAPSDLSLYGSGPQPKQGYFFAFDGLLWWIDQPDRTSIGFPGLSRLVYHSVFNWEIQNNSLDTGPMNAENTEGNRIEFGRVFGRHGWLFSTYRLNDQVQRFSSTDVDMVFLDVPDAFGARHLEGYIGELLGYDDDAPIYQLYFFPVDLPVSFDELLVENRVDTWNVELMYLYRMGQMHRGGFVEFFAGVRYMEFDETFQVEGRGKEVVNTDGDVVDGFANYRFTYDTGPDGDPTETNWSRVGPGNILANSNWVSEAENHIIGPQVGGRWFRKNGRWTLSAEGRFFAGWNIQNIRNHGVLGSELDAPSPWNWDFDPTDPLALPGLDLYMPILQRPYQFDHKAHLDEFTPGGELRVELLFELTRAVSVKAGWTGLWLGNIARGCAMPDYVISDASTMNVSRARNDQTVFINGLNIGLTVNR